MRIPRILHDSADLQVLARPGRSDFTLVTFGIMHSRADGQTFWGHALAEALDLDCIAVMPRAAHWYPAGPMQAALAAIRAHASRPLLGYGASMGAYAVLRYGAALGLETALAFGPQASIDPAIVGDGDRRYARFYRADRNRGEAVAAEHLPPRAFVFYDPFMAQDRLNRGLLPDSPRITAVTLPYLGHKTVMAAASSDIAGALFAHAMTGDARAMRRLLLPQRRLQPEFFRQMAAECLTRRQFRRAEAVARTGLGRGGPYDGDLHRIRAHCLVQLGRTAEALTASLAAHAAQPDDRRIQMQLADIHMMMDQPGPAIAVLRQIRSPNHLIHLRLAAAHEAAGDLVPALAATEAALTALPDNESLRRRHTRLLSARGPGAGHQPPDPPP